MHVIVVLGAPNDENGQLSAVALGRAETALREYRAHPGGKLLLTGGYGSHFNTTDKPHAHYAARFLTSRGAAPEDILPFAESATTIEDALLAERILRGYAVESLTVVTSGFHLRRARLIFEKVFPSQAITFVAAPDALSPEEYEQARRHEEEAIARLADFLGSGQEDG